MSDNASRATADCDVAIIGGGILGLFAAYRLARRGYSVVAFRLNNGGRPRADTLRNQGWLQSGLMYIGKIARFQRERETPESRRHGRLIARQMYMSGIAMLEELELELPGNTDRGIIRLDDNEEHVRTFQEDFQQLEFTDGDDDFFQSFRELTPSEARRQLGALYEDGRYFPIPDLPFPEARVLEVLRDKALDEDVVFVECNSPVKLERSDRALSGHSITWDGQRLSSRVTVLASGSGSRELLLGIGVNAPIKLQQTPLLVVKGCDTINVPIFANRSRDRGYSIVRHPPDSKRFFAGALVIGTGVVEEGIPFTHYDERRIRADLVDRFRALLPDRLQGHVKTGRFTAGYEVVPDNVSDDFGDPIHFVEPWVKWMGEDEGLRILFASPGRATSALQTANAILDRLEESPEEGGLGPPSVARKTVVTGGWNGGIYMHYDPHYRFDDRENSAP